MGVPGALQCPLRERQVPDMPATIMAIPATWKSTAKRISDLQSEALRGALGTAAHSRGR